MPCLLSSGIQAFRECVYSYLQPHLCQAQGFRHYGPQMPGFLRTLFQCCHQVPSFWILQGEGLAAVHMLWGPPFSWTANAGLLFSWLPWAHSKKQDGIPICPLLFSWQISLLPLTSQILVCERQTSFVKFLPLRGCD